MTAVSVLSLLAIHPGTPVTVLGDEATVRELAAADGPIVRHARLAHDRHLRNGAPALEFPAWVVDLRVRRPAREAGLRRLPGVPG